jgi:hypothetical protein
MDEKLTQDDVSKLYADIYNQMKAGVAEAKNLGKLAKFELADCSRESNINNILLGLCASDAAERLGIADSGNNKDLSTLTKELKYPETVGYHTISIPCPVIVRNEMAGDDKYKNLDTLNMVKVAAEVYQIANADKGKGKPKVQKHALNFQPLGSAVLKP